MYDWLGDALGNSATVVTANRRLARLLLAEYSAQQIALENLHGKYAITAEGCH